MDGALQRGGGVNARGHIVTPSIDAATALQGAVDDAFAEQRLRPSEVGGDHGTADITEAVLDCLDRSLPCPGPKRAVSAAG